MPQKKCLNQKRLTQKEVQALIETEGTLHQEFTQVFEQTYRTGHKDQPLVYELPGDRFLFVFDPKGTRLAGKGDIYPIVLIPIAPIASHHPTSSKAEQRDRSGMNTIALGVPHYQCREFLALIRNPIRIKDFNGHGRDSTRSMPCS